MADLTAEQILAADDMPVEKISIPEWGGDVFLRPMDGTQRDMVEGVTSKKTNMHATIASWSLCDKSGKLLFTKNQIELLSKKSGSALFTVVMAAMKINKLTGKDVEDLEKN